MKAQELRIGNLTLAKSPEKIEWIEGHPISIYDLEFLLHPSTASIPIDLKPIPLTEEWLLKFGFEHQKTSPTWYEIGLDETSFRTLCVSPEQKKAQLSQINDEEDASTMFDFFDMDSKTEHVHTLQNLYFALTGEELTIK